MLHDQQRLLVKNVSAMYVVMFLRYESESKASFFTHHAPLSMIFFSCISFNAAPLKKRPAQQLGVHFVWYSV